MTFAKLLARFLGRLSDGISLCLKEGAASGKMIDYIYRNQPSGKGFLGRWIDKRFLNHPGWKAIRIRRQSLEKLLIEAVIERQEAIRMIDIASGSAFYVLSVLKQTGKSDLQAVCQDLDPQRLEEGRAAAAASGLKNVIFHKGNALDADVIRNYNPHIAISSGFYDGINDSVQIQDSIRSIYNALMPTGTFILTIQTDYPNFVRSIFADFNKPMKTTIRSADKMAQWLQSAGFLIEKTLRDSYGHCALFKARKP
jgi:ubiquinone/menaquinone biosynthesis C-methylase UbiE